MEPEKLALFEGIYSYFVVVCLRLSLGLEHLIFRSVFPSQKGLELISFLDKLYFLVGKISKFAPNCIFIKKFINNVDVPIFDQHNKVISKIDVELFGLEMVDDAKLKLIGEWVFLQSVGGVDVGDHVGFQFQLFCDEGKEDVQQLNLQY